MRGRLSSINRLMLATGLVGMACYALRSRPGWYPGTFSTPDLMADWILGELAIPLAYASVLGVASLYFRGRWRRALIVALLGTSIAALLVWVAPVSWRSLLMHRVILPVDRLLGPRDPSSRISLTALSTGWIIVVPEMGQLFRLNRDPFLSAELQTELGLLLIAVGSLLGVSSLLLRSAAPSPPG